MSSRAIVSRYMTESFDSSRPSDKATWDACGHENRQPTRGEVSFFVLKKVFSAQPTDNWNGWAFGAPEGHRSRALSCRLDDRAKRHKRNIWGAQIPIQVGHMTLASDGGIHSVVASASQADSRGKRPANHVNFCDGGTTKTFSLYFPKRENVKVYVTEQLDRFQIKKKKNCSPTDS